MTLLLAAALTFHHDIEPLLQKRCQGCHRPGEIGPMPLETYAQVRPWAKAIREQVIRRKMPPWFADRSVGHFANDPSLSEAEIRMIDDWVKAGAPEGRKEDAPKPTAWTLGWNIPPPEMVIGAPKPFTVPANQEVDYQFIVIPLGLPEDRWVTMAEVRPSERSVVHHAVLYVRERGDPWPENGTRVTKSDILAVYTPGQGPMACPPGMAKKIPAGADLVLQMHYTPIGKVVSDQTRVGLVFAKEAPQRRVMTLQLATTEFRIPAGESNHRVSASGTLPNEALLLSFFPHMHLRGKAFEYELDMGEGRVETLLRVKPYDFYWQLSYRLDEPRLLKKGLRLRAIAWYDNSANNPRNPDPTVDVTYGEQSREEMMVGFFDVAVDPGIDKQIYFIR